MRALLVRTVIGAVMVLVAGCASEPPVAPTTQERALEVPAYVKAAVAGFLQQNSRWSVQWLESGSTVRLTGPGLAVPGLGEVQGQDQAELASKLAAVVAANRDVLGLRGLDVRFAGGSRAGSVWFLRGSLERKGIPVTGHVDCGIAAKDGKVVLLSSQVPPGVAELDPLATARPPKAAEADAAQFAGLRAGQTEDRIGKGGARLLVWWDPGAAGPQRATLAYSVFVTPRPAVDKAGGTYIVDAHKPVLLKFIPGVHHVGAARRAGHDAAPPAGTAAPAGRTPRASGLAASSQAPTIQVRAFVRTGLGATGGTTLEPMPFLDLVWVSAAGMTTVQTDALGQLSIPAAPGDSLTTSMTGGMLAATQPAVPFTMNVAAAPPGAMVPCNIVDGPGSTDQLERATVWHWTAQALWKMIAVVGQLNELGDVALIGCSIGGNPTCDAQFQEPTWLYFSTNGAGCRCYAFDTIILHEWAHALDYMCGGTHEEALAEAFADMVAMFFTEQPRIGVAFDGINHLRTGSDLRKPTAPVPVHGHSGEPLMQFAWHVRADLIAKDPVHGADWANSLFLGQVGGDPPDTAEFLRRVFLADDDDHDPATPSPDFTILVGWARTCGLMP